MRCVIKKGTLYVAHFGSAGSYTAVLANAQKFDSLESAKRHVCPENERIVPLHEEVRRAIGE